MTAKAVFVDTAGWMMLADAADPAHQRARSFRDTWLERGGIFVCTDFVLDETLTLLRIRLGIDAAERWWDQVMKERKLRTVLTSDRHFVQASFQLALTQSKRR